MLGSAKSITTTSGFSDVTRASASCPSPASPTTEIPGSSSSSRRNPAPHQVVVVNQQNADFLLRHAPAPGADGTVTRTSVPPPSRTAISIVPFIISARSRIDTSPNPCFSLVADANAIILYFE